MARCTLPLAALSLAVAAAEEAGKGNKLEAPESTAVAFQNKVAENR